jgi:hypothetical protein
MKMCLDHWNKLRAAIDAHGLTPLVSQGGKSAVMKMVDALKHGPNIHNFDPLMSAHNQIVAHAVEVGGIEMLQIEGCPICFLQTEHDKYCETPNCEQDFEKWIDYAADGSKAYLDQQMQQKES